MKGIPKVCYILLLYAGDILWYFFQAPQSQGQVNGKELLQAPGQPEFQSPLSPCRSPQAPLWTGTGGFL